MPDFIWSSLLRAYQLYYNEQLGQLERDEYFQLNRTVITCKGEKGKCNLNRSKSSHDDKKDGECLLNTSIDSSSTDLVTYYDLLMAIVAHKNKTSLDCVEFRSCIWEHSTLEARLESVATNNNNSDKKVAFESLRSKQPAHLSDSDLKLIIKRKRTLKSLDLCPCNLTNRSVVLLNKYLNKNLKYLRLQNCCNWVPDEPKGGELDSEDEELGIGIQRIELPNLLADSIRFRYVNEDGVNSEEEDEDFDGEDMTVARQQEDQSNERDHNEYFISGDGVLSVTSSEEIGEQISENM